ncbi:MAG: cupin domain-containing protein [Bacteroidia bacterium]|nr:cupin domain-containing protein [Bacteroidia bacterium]
MNRLDQIILKLDLKPHPEGGFFRETYRSAGVISHDSLDHSYKGERNYSTCIYFLLTSEVFSAFHRITQDEIWHFYDGSPIEIHTIAQDGVYAKTVIGPDIDREQVPQFVVPGGSWFAATVINPDDYSLIGCTVSPGFDFRDFELPLRNELISKFPQHEEIIAKLTR